MNVLKFILGGTGVLAAIVLAIGGTGYGIVIFYLTYCRPPPRDDDEDEDLELAALQMPDTISDRVCRMSDPEPESLRVETDSETDATSSTDDGFVSDY